MPAVLVIFNEPIMSCFSPPGLPVATYAHRVGWKQSKYSQASRDDDATARLDVEGQEKKKNHSQNYQQGFTLGQKACSRDRKINRQTHQKCVRLRDEAWPRGRTCQTVCIYYSAASKRLAEQKTQRICCMSGKRLYYNPGGSEALLFAQILARSQCQSSLHGYANDYVNSLQCISRCLL